MSTWLSFYIKTHDKDKVVNKLKSLSGINAMTEGTFPDDHYDSFLMDEGYPDYLVIGMTQPDWVTVRYNSSNKLTDWCIEISKEFETPVVLVLAQSVSDYYYFAYYDKGRKLRELEFCYSEDFESVDFGEKLNFEKIQSSEEYEELFDFERIDEYCKNIGLNIQEDYYKTQWTILKGTTRRKTTKKPWWKFW